MTGGADDLWKGVPAATSSENLTSQTVGAFKWTYGSYAVTAVIQLGYTAAMARLLSPRDFGLVAMASLFLRFGEHFAQMGVGQALIQKAQLTGRDIRSGFTATLALGLAMSAAFVVAAPLAGSVFKSDTVVPVARVLAFSFALHALGITAKSLLRRDLQFRTLAVVEVTSSVLGYMAVGVIAAMLGAGVWSLVIAALSQALVSSMMAMALGRHPLRLLLAWPEVRSLYSFGGRVSIISFLEFLGTSLDTLFIGRFAGEALLGQYNRARLLVKLPLDQLTQGTSKVLFPAFSRIQADAQRLRGAYLSGLRMISVMVVPAAAGMAVASDELALVVLGPQWQEAGDVLPYLAFLVAATLTSKMAAITCEATATLNAKLVLTLGHVALLALLLTLSIGGSLEAYALAIAVAGGLRLLAYTTLMNRVVGVSLVEHLRVLSPVALTAAATGSSIWGVTLALDGVMASGFIVIAQVATGAVVLTAALTLGPLGEVRRDIHRRLSHARLLPPGRSSNKILERILRQGR